MESPHGLRYFGYHVPECTMQCCYCRNPSRCQVSETIICLERGRRYLVVGDKECYVTQAMENSFISHISWSPVSAGTFQIMMHVLTKRCFQNTWQSGRHLPSKYLGFRLTVSTRHWCSFDCRKPEISSPAGIGGSPSAEPVQQRTAKRHLSTYETHLLYAIRPRWAKPVIHGADISLKQPQSPNHFFTFSNATRIGEEQAREQTQSRPCCPDNRDVPEFSSPTLSSAPTFRNRGLIQV